MKTKENFCNNFYKAFSCITKNIAVTSNPKLQQLKWLFCKFYTDTKVGIVVHTLVNNSADKAKSLWNL